MHHPEAVAVSFWKLLVVGVWKVVASRGWWWQKCTTTMAGLTVDCSHFLHLEAGRLPYAATGCQIDYIFVFVAWQQMPPLKNDNQTGIIWKLWQSVSGSWWQLVSRSWWWLVSGRWWHLEAGGSGNATTTVAGLTVLNFCTQKQVGYHMPPLPGWLIFCLCSTATDATATMAIVRCQIFLGTPLLLLLLLVDCSFLQLEACGSWWPGWLYLLFSWQGNKPPLTMAIAAHCHQVDCAFFLMEWHCGLISAPSSMQFAAHCLPHGRLWYFWTTMANAYHALGQNNCWLICFAVAILSYLPLLIHYLFCGIAHCTTADRLFFDILNGTA